MDVRKVNKKQSGQCLMGQPESNKLQFEECLAVGLK